MDTETNRTKTEPTAILRQRAEAILRGQLANLKALSSEDVQVLIHELQVHQLELEMQNEELRQTQVELEQTRDQYIDLYDFAPVGYFTICAKGSILAANLAGANLIGLERGTLLKQPFSRFVAQDSQDVYYKYLRQASQTKTRQRCELALVKADGSSLFVQLESIAVAVNEGDDGQFRMAVMDISERKAMMLAHLRQHHRLELLHTLDEATLARWPLEDIAQTALTGLHKLIPCRRASIVLYDFAQAEATVLAAWADTDTVQGSQARRPLAMHREIAALQTGAVRRVEDISILPQPSAVETLLQAEGIRAYFSVPLLTQDELYGTLNVGYGRSGPFATEHIEVAKEIAEQLAIAIQQARLREQIQHYTATLEGQVAERTTELQEERNFIATILDTAGALVAVLDKTGGIVRMNRAFEQVVGYTIEELSGKPVWEMLILPEELEQAQAAFAQLSVGQGPNAFETHLVSKTGDRHRIAWSNSVLFDADGEVEYIIGTGLDITERKAMEMEKVQLFDEVREQRDHLQALMVRLAEIQETERKELSRELHDQVGRDLTALDLNLSVMQTLLDKTTGASDLLQARLSDSLSLVKQMAHRIRTVMANLRPPMLDDYGLVPALQWYGEALAARVSFKLTVQGEELARRLPAAVELALFRIAQEALTNITKHAQASQATITISEAESIVRLVIFDDGLGFNSTHHIDPIKQQSWGLITMVERAEAVGATCRIESKPGQGTQVIVEVPQSEGGNE